MQIVTRYFVRGKQVRTSYKHYTHALLMNGKVKMCSSSKAALEAEKRRLYKAYTDPVYEADLRRLGVPESDIQLSLEINRRDAESLEIVKLEAKQEKKG